LVIFSGLIESTAAAFHVADLIAEGRDNENSGDTAGAPMTTTASSAISGWGCLDRDEKGRAGGGMA
jgi:hypothetical protein